MRRDRLTVVVELLKCPVVFCEAETVVDQVVFDFPDSFPFSIFFFQDTAYRFFYFRFVFFEIFEAFPETIADAAEEDSGTVSVSFFR